MKREGTSQYTKQTQQQTNKHKSNTMRRMPNFSVVVSCILCLFVFSSLCSVVGAEEELNVFIIPHSHCDPGWLNTFDGYFNQQVNRILTNVVQKLLSDSSKKFVWAEISFFEKWYSQQPNKLREDMKAIVDNGQLEFVAGGWVQNDEANANFDDVIDQVTEGHEFLLRTFGVVPRVAWQIDPFGHSSLTPSLFARMGFEALVINRIHYELKASFKQNKQMEFTWQGSRSLGRESEIFTHVLHTHYSAPEGYDWEEYRNSQVSQGNVAQRARDLIWQLKQRSNAYRTNNLLVPFGDDFKFQNAQVQFQSMDLLIDYINSHKSEFNVQIQYSTVSQYFDAVFKTSKEKNTVFPHYEGDFFPYADNPGAYWSGYYTTRPYLKGLSRGTDAHVKAAEGLYAAGRIVSTYNSSLSEKIHWADLFKDILDARRDCALVMHHDGITGTAKQFVADDYASRLNRAKDTSKRTIKSMMEMLLTDKAAPDLFDKKTFDFSDTETYAFVIHNPLGWTRRKYVSVITTTGAVVIYAADGGIVQSQIIPVWDHVEGSASQTEYELFFMVEVPPVGITTYFVTKTTSQFKFPQPSTTTVYTNKLEETKPGSSGVKKMGTEHMFIENEHLFVSFSNQTGLISSIFNKDMQVGIPVNQELMDYTTYESGAYIFRPINNQPTYPENVKRIITVTQGNLVSQTCVYIHPANTMESSICMRVFGTASVFEEQQQLEVGGFVQVTYNLIGRGNLETVGRYSTNLNTEGTFYTDNGLEVRGRKVKGRTEADYYPNLSMGYLLAPDTNIQFMVLSRQAMGTSSPKNGAIEHMMHRNLNQDDGRGLAEPNRDGSRISVQVFLYVLPVEPAVRIGRRMALALQHYPRSMIGKAPEGRTIWGDNYKTRFEPLAEELPSNTHLVSFKARDASSDDVIIRFLHIFEDEQHARLSKPSELKWNMLFNKNWNVVSTRERSLAITMDIDVAQKRRPIFAPSNEPLQHVSGIAPEFDKQNTEEEGVFISQAALDELKKQKELDEQQQRQTRSLNRKLLQLDDGFGDSFSVDSFILHPMQIKSFLAHIQPIQLPELTSQQQLPQTEQPTETPTQKQLPTEPKQLPTEPNQFPTEPKQQFPTINDKPQLPKLPETQKQPQPQVQPPPNQPDQPNKPIVVGKPENDVVRPRPTKPSKTQNQNKDVDVTEGNDVSHKEVSALLVVSVVCTVLMIVAYTRLRSRSKARKELVAKRKEMVSIV